ncbi:MAG: HNH endonuclease [Actinomycetota bacterium]|nr:HNH endonuclease [Actinomycetota bacterium]
MKRPCLDCGALCRGTRCNACQRRREAARGPQRAAYNDPSYQAARQVLRGATCHLCGQPGADTIDHVVPLAAGGANVASNWAPAHRSCNSRKGPR